MPMVVGKSSEDEVVNVCTIIDITPGVSRRWNIRLRPDVYIFIS